VKTRLNSCAVCSMCIICNFKYFWTCFCTGVEHIPCCSWIFDVASKK